MEFQVNVVNKVKTDEHPVTQTVPNYFYDYPYQTNPYPQNPYSQYPYYTPQPNPYNYNSYSPGYRYQTTYIKDQHNYTQSSITVNMIDNKRNQLVWTATVQADIYDNSQQNVQNDIHPAVHKMLEYFPIKRVVPEKK